ncbi:hypothetical protein QTP86_015513 [Hemibagrus guttatus]|nr:hypothetical protein QTP86_015513 [Hemibagrus guttatus]
MDTFMLAAVLLLFTGGVSAQVLEPLNATVLQNTDARFNCSVKTPGWVAMTWTVNGRLAIIISENTGLLTGNATYSATNYTTAGEYKWEFVMKAVTAASAGFVGCQVQNNLLVSTTLTVQQNGTVAITGSNRTATEGDQVTFLCIARSWLPAPQLFWAVNGTLVDKVLYNTESNGTLMNSNSTLTITAKANVSVDCLASISTLPSPEISTIFLTVQKAVPRPARDQTVLIAITVAFSLAALLALLIILIVFCCKRRRRKRSRYQDELRAQSLSHRQQAAYARTGRVRENFGYVEDTPSVDNRDGVYTISSFRQQNYNNNIQLPEVNSSRYADDRSYDGYSFDGLQKHRHLTIV